MGAEGWCERRRLGVRTQGCCGVGMEVLVLERWNAHTRWFVV